MTPEFCSSSFVCVHQDLLSRDSRGCVIKQIRFHAWFPVSFQRPASVPLRRRNGQLSDPLAWTLTDVELLTRLPTRARFLWLLLIHFLARRF